MPPMGTGCFHSGGSVSQPWLSPMKLYGPDFPVSHSTFAELLMGLLGGHHRWLTEIISLRPPLGWSKDLKQLTKVLVKNKKAK